jgi:hypothetical protein
MLTTGEQRVWDDVQRFWAEEAEEPSRPPDPNGSAADVVSQYADDLPFPVVAGIWIAIGLLLLGAMAASVVVGASTALGWAGWHVGRWASGPPDQRTGGGSPWRVAASAGSHSQAAQEWRIIDRAKASTVP